VTHPADQSVLPDQVAIVTGASRGIGRGIAVALARAGARVVVNERRPGAGREVVQEITGSGGEAVAVGADVTEPAGADRLVQAALEHWGRLDLLVNNAGGWGSAPSETVPLDDWHRLLALNLTSVFLVSQRAARVMLERGAGAIVNISSIMASVAVPRRAAYSAATAGVEQLTAVLACEWADRGVRVNSVAPGFINTSAPGPPEPGADYDSVEISARTPLGLWGTVDDVAGAVVFLASPAARHITGQTLYVDGGWTKYGGWRRFTPR
jgi:3-oxoacyl-[acyl-carrier protein] reductase